MNKLQNKIVVVTGGTGLIGREIIKDIEVEGGIAINFDVEFDVDISKQNIYCDVTNEQSIKDGISTVISKYGKIDGWVNNAYPRTSNWGAIFENINYENWKSNVDLQMNSVFVCCQLILKIMSEQGWGNIVNMSSIYGIVGPDFTIYEKTDMTMPAAYSAIKGGIINFTRYLASYYGKQAIRINCVSPGGVLNKQNVDFIANYTAKVPLNRMAQASEIAPVVSFLLSDSASYITGHNLVVDGGWTCI